MSSFPVNKNLLLSTVIITSLVNPFLGAAVNIALPKISDEFSLNAVTMSWVAMSFLVTSSIFLLPFGKLADIVGRKKVFLVGNVIIVVSSLLCFIAQSGVSLIIYRVLQGIGSAMMFGTGMAIVTSVFPPHERGKALGINVTAVYLGLSAAPLIGGFLIQSFGWRSLFLVPIPVGLIVIGILILAIKTEWAEAKSDRFDYKGSVVYMISMFSFMYGFSKIPDIHAIILTLVGIIGILLFIKVELKVEFPLLNIQLFSHNKVFAYSNLAALINYATTFAVTFVLSLYLQYVKGFQPRETGIILVTQPVVMALVASFSGKLSDRYDPRILASGGMMVTLIGLITLSFLNEFSTIQFITIALIILGIGFGLFTSPNTNSVMSSVDKRYLGIASATVGTMRLTGQMISMGIATLFIHIFIGKAKISTDNLDQFLKLISILFIVFAFLCLVGVFASLARGKKIT